MRITRYRGNVSLVGGVGSEGNTNAPRATYATYATKWRPPCPVLQQRAQWISNLSIVWKKK